MNHYRLKFTGRQRGAIGIFHPCQVDVWAEDEEAAWIKAYDTHEHIAGRKAEILPQGPQDDYDPTNPNYRRYQGD
jgi:hypothetical protein